MSRRILLLILAGALALAFGLGAAFLFTKRLPGGELETSVTDVTVVAPPPPPTTFPEPVETVTPEPDVDRRCWTMFGGGVRRCLGAAFAQLEMKVVISAILRRARLRAGRAADEKPRFRGVTVMPSRGGEAIVEAVNAAAG